jgi:YggT family protein
MFVQIAQFLIDTVAGLFVFLLLARFHFQWLRVPFRNQLGEFIVLATNWLVKPARKVVPSIAGLDLATWIAAWLLQALALYVLNALRGYELGPEPGLAVALLAGLALLDLLRYSLYILMFAVIVQAVLSWVNPYSPVAPLFDAIARPFLRPIRRFVPLLANIDLSPLVLLVALQVLLIPLWHLRSLLAAGSA